MFLQAGLLVLCLAAVAQGAPRVIGGHDAPNHRYPYQISMRATNGGSHMCSGSIMNERWILTAAHCVQNYHVGDFVISTGTNFLNETGIAYVPKRIIIHEDYTSFYQNDIALIRLEKDIVFSDFVKTIDIPAEDLKDYSRTAEFAGWGSTELWGPAPNALQEIFLNVVTVEECKKQQVAVTERHICTLTKYGEGICHGDSGGPLVVDGQQVGIASYVRPCAINYPDVYTRVYSYRDWILKHVQGY